MTVSHRGERFASCPWGLHGGGAAGRARAFILRRDGRREELPSKRMVVLHPGDQLWEYVAGGGGHGDPLERDPEVVRADVLDGKVSRGTARTAHGVVLAGDAASVDAAATKACREAMHAARGPVAWVFDRGDGARE